MERSTGRLRIRDFTPADEAPLFRLLSDPAVMRHLEPPFTRAETAAFLKKAGLGTPPLIYAVEEQGGPFVGYVIWHPYEADTLELGWVLSRHVWGKGYASELTRALMEESGGRGLVIECAPEQAATRAIAEKFGFRFCGVTEGCAVYRFPGV